MGQNIALYASPAARNLFLSNLILSDPVIFFFPPNFSRVFPMLAVANAESCVSLQNKLGHRAHRHRRLMQVPVLRVPAGRGGFFLRLRGFWENVRPFIPRLRFFFKSKISSGTLIPFFMRGSVHSGSASWDDCRRMFPYMLRVSSFPDMFLHYVWTAV